MKKQVCLVLCGVAIAACSRGNDTPRTPEMHTQQPTETWSMPGTEMERSPTYQAPSSAPGSLDQERELPSTDGTGDEGFVVPDDPAGDTLGTPGSSDIEDRGTPGTPGGTTTPGTPGTYPPGTNPPGGTAPGTPGTAPTTPPRPGQNPGAAPGTPGGATPPGGTTPPSGGTP